MPEERRAGDAAGDVDKGRPPAGEEAERIVLRAMSRDPSLEEDRARRLAAATLGYIEAGVDPDDAPELARRLLSGDLDASRSTASVVAAAAAEVLGSDGAEG